ncbi:glutathione S-transferase [Novosphingobium terrae]|uniref:glutathione S-transferase n=1 Tax=Novosphingobium terrae TaxID=2726189 RepID=UPI001982697F|nr:glutathione S-transferase [Novosphingobium terrae]
MADYDLYYWPVPFRGQFIRAILTFAGKTWREQDADTIGQLLETAPKEQPIPFMGPPVLIDHGHDFVLAQMPAIALYLGETLDLLPATPQARALTAKVVNDANDVLDEMTRDGGSQMWDAASWQAFLPRLQRWMTIWDATGASHGLTATDGFLLGTHEPGVADIVTATLWATMGDRFPDLAALLRQTAPSIAALTRRMQAYPTLARLSRESRETYGDAWCGGQIEASLRQVLQQA